jgi:hypothetical protein
MYSPEAGRVIAEQIIQASDVSHTMQHFDTFNKWNERIVKFYPHTKAVGTHRARRLLILL